MAWSNGNNGGGSWTMTTAAGGTGGAGGLGGTGTVYTTTTTAPITASTIGVGTWTPQCFEHETLTGDVEYLDGKVISSCKHCGARISVSRIPGGLNALQAREFAESVLVMAHEGTLTGEELERLFDLDRALKTEIETLNGLRELFDVLRDLIDLT